MPGLFRADDLPPAWMFLDLRVPREEPPWDHGVNLLGYLPMSGEKGGQEALSAALAPGTPSPGALAALSRQALDQWFLGRSRRNGKATMRAMYRHVPSIHTRRCERVPPPARVDFDADQVLVTPALAFRLAGRSAYAEHLVQRLLFEGEGKAVLWKLAVSLRAAVHEEVTPGIAGLFR